MRASHAPGDRAFARRDFAPERRQRFALRPPGAASFCTIFLALAYHESMDLWHRPAARHEIVHPNDRDGEARICPSQNLGDRYRIVVRIFIRQLLQGEPLTIIGNGEQTRSFTYIDVAPHIARAAAMPEPRNETFNIGAGSTYTVNELAHAVGEALGVEPEIHHSPTRYEVNHAIADCRKAIVLFGPSKTPLRDGLAHMVSWAREGGMRRSIAPSVEISKSLPETWCD